MRIHYRSGTRIPTGATIEASTPDGAPVHFDVESKLAVPTHVGGGYGGDSDWSHGMWKGEKFVERRTYDMTDPTIIARAGFGVIDTSVARYAATATGIQCRAGVCLNTGRWAATTHRGSPTGLRWRPRRFRLTSAPVRLSAFASPGFLGAGRETARKRRQPE